MRICRRTRPGALKDRSACIVGDSLKNHLLSLNHLLLRETGSTKRGSFELQVIVTKMKSILLKTAPLIVCFALTAISGFSQNTFISSLSQPLNVAQTFPSIGVGYDFTTDNQVYNLSFIDLTIRQLKDPVSFQGSIFATDSIGRPVGLALATVFNVVDHNFLNPNPNGGLDVVGFDFHSLQLGANTTYAFVAGAGEDTAYEVWGSRDVGFSRPDGGDWDLSSSSFNYFDDEWHQGRVSYVPALAISAVGAVAVPEPSTYGYLGCVLLIAGIVFRRARA